MTKSINAILGLIIAIGAYALISTLLFVFTPNISKMLEDLDVELPHLTLFIMNTRLPLAWTSTGLIGVIVVGSILFNHKPDIALTIQLIGLAVAVLAIAVIAIAFVLPFITHGRPII